MNAIPMVRMSSVRPVASMLNTVMNVERIVAALGVDLNDRFENILCC